VYLFAATRFHYHQRKDAHQDRFLLAGNFTAAAVGIAFGQDVLSTTLSILPWIILLSLVLSALAHSIFEWRLHELAQEEEHPQCKADGVYDTSINSPHMLIMRGRTLVPD
jgi:hypothetical protein